MMINFIKNKIDCAEHEEEELFGEINAGLFVAANPCIGEEEKCVTVK